MNKFINKLKSFTKKVFYNSALYKQLEPLLLTLKDSADKFKPSKITIDIKTKVYNISKDDNIISFDDKLFKIQLEIENYYINEKLKTENIILRKNEIEFYEKTLKSVCTSALFGMLVTIYLSFVTKLSTFSTYIEKTFLENIVMIIVVLISVICVVLVLITATFKVLNSQKTLSLYNSYNLKDFEEDIIKKILLKRKDSYKAEVKKLEYKNINDSETMDVGSEQI